jgi:hypothetical protein
VLVSTTSAQGAHLASQLDEAQLRADLARRQYAAFHQAALDQLENPLAMPTMDIDTLASTDLEDLFTFACDLFEFLYQEHALFCAAFGYSTGLRIATGAALAVYAFKRIIASQRHK